jgi:hypothetical protein
MIAEAATRADGPALYAAVLRLLAGVVDNCPNPTASAIALRAIADQARHMAEGLTGH